MAIPWLKLGMWTFVIVIDGLFVFFGLMSASKEASVGEKRMYNAIEAFLLIVLSVVNLRNMYAKYTMAAAKKGPPSLLRKWASRLYRIAMWLAVLAIDVLEICLGLLIGGDNTSDDEKRYYRTWQLILLIALSVLFVVNLYIKSHIATSAEERLPMLAGDMESGSSVTPEPSVSVTTQPNKTSTGEIPVRFESHQDMGTCSTE